MARTLVTFALGLLLVVGLIGCASQSKPLAIAGPLRAVSSWPAGEMPSHNSSFTVTLRGDQVRIVGDRGTALNAATELHRRLLRLDIQNEILCELADSSTRTQSLTLTFPRALTSEQSQKLADVLAGMRPRG